MAGVRIGIIYKVTNINTGKIIVSDNIKALCEGYGLTMNTLQNKKSTKIIEPLLNEDHAKVGLASNLTLKKFMIG